MTLHDQLCSIEQAEELKRLGVTQQSLFYYVNNWLNPRKQPIDNGEFIIIGTEKHKCKRKAEIRGANIEFVSSFSVAELGELLGKHIHIVSYSETYGDFYMYWPTTKHFDTEAQARAFVLIQLIKEGLESIESINTKLKDYILPSYECF